MRKLVYLKKIQLDTKKNITDTGWRIHPYHPSGFFFLHNKTRKSPERLEVTE
jgi:hypothetical protein